MQRIEHSLLSPSLGSQKTLVAFHFGTPGARPKVYIQASLHAEELPGMLVAHHLREHLTAADQAGLLRGEVVLVPVANPIGLSQRLDHRAMGRFEFDTAQNFNRHYPDMAEAVLGEARTRLGPDAQANVATVRRLVGAWLEQWQPASELDSLRRQLLLLAHDADLVLDLHCDNDAVIHLYSEEACWPPLEPLARLLGCHAVLLARESGGGPFDERLSGLWWQLAAALRAAGVNAPLPQACASTTVELRGEGDVSHDLAREDAQGPAAGDEQEVIKFPAAVFAKAKLITYGATLSNLAFKASDGVAAVRFQGKAGDRIVFRAHTDLVIGLTACSALQSNNGSFKPIDWDVTLAI